MRSTNRRSIRTGYSLEAIGRFNSSKPHIEIFCNHAAATVRLFDDAFGPDETAVGVGPRDGACARQDSFIASNTE